MAPSVTQQKLIALGEQLVASLGDAHQTDTLSRWMAHYVAEQIQRAKTSTGAKKAQAEKQAFDTILALWSHRASFPDGLRPFEGFEPILRLLKRLDPDNPRLLFDRIVGAGVEEAYPAQTPSETKLWLDFVKCADITARTVIRTALENAAMSATTPSARALLESVEPSADADEFAAIKKMLGQDEQSPEAAQLEQLERRLRELALFRQLARKVEIELKEHLDRLKAAPKKQRARTRPQRRKRSRDRG